MKENNYTKNLDDISGYFDEDIINIVYKDLELNKNNMIDLSIKKKKK